MRLPFFRSSKSETQKILIAPPTPPSKPQAPALSREIQPTSESTTDAPIAVDRSRLATSPDSSPGQTIPLSLGKILSQLPANVLVPGSQTDAAFTTINIPAEWIVPQLSTGRISVKVTDLLPLIPAKLVQGATAQVHSQHTVLLPLADIVPVIPPELLTREYETSLNVDTPEYQKFPKLFDDSALEPAETVAVEEPEAEPATIPIQASRLVTEPAAAATDTAPEEIATEDGPAPEDHISVSLRSLVAVMPDHVFVYPRKELWRHVNLETKIHLPLDLVLPQLKEARVRVPLAAVIRAMPKQLFVNPLPQIANETVPLSLPEIVPQLSPAVFAKQFRGTQQDVPATDNDEDIPTPFLERTEAPAEPSPAPATCEAPALEPEVEPAIEEIVEGQPVVAEEVAPVEEDVAIFAEKTEPVEVAPVEAVEPEPEPEPVVESEPEPEPVAEIAPDEPVEQPVVEVAAVEESPVIEEPTEATEPEPVLVHAETPVESSTAENKHLINLNNCTVDELIQIHGIGPSLAHRIIEYRTANGEFKSVHDLRKVPGIGRKTYRTLAGPEPRSLNRLLGVPHNEELTLQEIVRMICTLKGVDGAILAMSDGVFLTGELPSHLDQTSISVFAPQLFRKVSRYMRELRVGQVSRMSVFTDQQPISIFRAGEVYLVVIHDTRHFSKALLRRCERISQEIARLCRQRAVV